MQGPLQQAAPQAPAIPGVNIVTNNESVPPVLLVEAEEKIGKSTLGVSLADWPRPGMHPLYLAFDETGPNSCLALGYQPHKIVIADWPGATLWEKAYGVVQMLHANRANLTRTYSSIIVDCVSSMIGFLLDDYRRTTKNPDPRYPYAEVGRQHLTFLNRIVELKLPSIWLSWMKHAEWVDEKSPAGQKVRTLHPGGALIEGRQIRSQVVGRAHHILILEKQKIGVGAQGADAEGYQRVFHTRTWKDIVAGGRYANDLPPQCGAHLGWVLSQITKTGPFAPQVQQVQQVQR